MEQPTRTIKANTKLILTGEQAKVISDILENTLKEKQQLYLYALNLLHNMPELEEKQETIDNG